MEAFVDGTERIFTLGITAHVDAGKTTLSEAMLYTAGAIKSAGRVDHGDAFLDTEQVEKARGITVFSKMARLTWAGEQWILLDTPGHVDFGAEAERAMSVMDAAVLVISGTDGVQPHTRTILKLLAHYAVPVFIFVNKMDLPGADRDKVLTDLNAACGGGCADFSGAADHENTWLEEVATSSEEMLNAYLETGDIPGVAIARSIYERKCFPVWFGSALRMEGVRAFMDGIARYLALFPRNDEVEKNVLPGVGDSSFGAKVFKISRDPQGTRLTWLRVLSGTLQAKSVIETGGESGKVDQIRLYSGDKFAQVQTAGRGEVCAVTGLQKTRPGMGLGSTPDEAEPVLQPVETRTLVLPEGADALDVYRKLGPLADTFPEMHLAWNQKSRTITARLMGSVQTEIFTRAVEDGLGIRIAFGPPRVIYKETVTKSVEGVGHFEPLRHYAEVHLLIEPGDPESGIQVTSALSTDRLSLNWQKQILSVVSENEHTGVLTGSSLTDVRITLVAGKASVKHTEGGDFREASLRAVRQGLMETECALLEPVYSFALEVPEELVGRAMKDLSDRSAAGNTQEYTERGGRRFAVLTGTIPALEAHGYSDEVRAYTRGEGDFSLAFAGYRPCHNAEEVIASIGYDAEADTEHPASSVFCAHGAGVIVPWELVPEYMHLPYATAVMGADREAVADEALYEGAEGFRAPRGSERGEDSGGIDSEFLSIFKREFGADSEEAVRENERKRMQAGQPGRRKAAQGTEKKPVRTKPDTRGAFLIVDGYNVIHAWPYLAQLFSENMDAARGKLVDLLENYHGTSGIPIAVVFDAWKVKGNLYGSHAERNGVEVIYTRENETADSRIERMVHELGGKYKITVATSDGLEQLTVLRLGALRMSARELMEEITG